MQLLEQEKIDALGLEKLVSCVLSENDSVPVTEFSEQLPPGMEIEEILVTNEQIQLREWELAKDILDYSLKWKNDREMESFTGLFLFLEKGAKVFAESLYEKIIGLSNLAEYKGINFEIDSMKASSYTSEGSIEGEACTSGRIKIKKWPSKEFEQIDYVFVIDDIGDTRLTCFGLKPIVANMYSSHVSTAVLLNKQGQQKYDIPLDFIGFNIKNRYVVGYGLDSTEDHHDAAGVLVAQTEYCRGLHDVAILRSSQEPSIK